VGDLRPNAVPPAVATDHNILTSAADLIADARAWIETNHPHPRHLEQTLVWLDRLAPAATGPVRLAALLHDIERATPDPDSPFDSARDWNRDAYLDYHQGRSAAHLADWMAGHGASSGDTEVAVALVAVHERGGWRDADLVQAADSLSFIETMTPLLADWVASGRSSGPTALAKLDNMWQRIRVPRARELGGEVYESARLAYAAQTATR
jgi:hypothetical protein